MKEAVSECISVTGTDVANEFSAETKTLQRIGRATNLLLSLNRSFYSRFAAVLREQIGLSEKSHRKNKEVYGEN
jgi:hypothetical protein